jgi:hypothetical protein
MDPSQEINEEEENEEEDRISYSPTINYDPNMSEKIICVQLENNQQIFMEYKEAWTVQDLILSVLCRHEYQLLNPNRNIILSATQHPELFDFNLCFYDKIMESHENRVADYIVLDKLHDLHILKNYRTPFFILKDNFMPSSYIYSGKYKLDQLKEVKDSNFNHYAMYLDYMPKSLKWNFNLIMAHPELEDYFVRNKKGYNEFMPFKRNMLTCDKKTIDWFIYDQESMKFLLEMEKKEYVENSNLKYINGQIYFEDKYEETFVKKPQNNADQKRKFSFSKKLGDKDLSNVLINLTIDLSTDTNPKNIQSHKFKITSGTTAYELIEKLGAKLCAANKSLKFDAKKKILKVRSQNDYVFGIFEPIINFQYVNECVKLNKIANYLVIDNPGTDASTQAGKNYNTNDDANTSVGDLNTSAVGGLRRAKAGGKYDLRSIAAYNPTLNNYTGDIGNPIVVLEKQINNDNKDKNEKLDTKNQRNKYYNISKSGRRANSGNSSAKDNLESFVNLLNQELEKEIEIQLRNDDLTPKKNNEENTKNQNNENVEYTLVPKSRLLRLNDENSKYLKKRKKYKNFAMNLNKKNIFKEAMNPTKNESQNNSALNQEKRTINYSKRSLTSKDNKKNILFKQRNPLINKEELFLSDINRPFSILLRGANIVPSLNSTENESKFTTVLLFKFELFSSNSSMCPPKQIRWKTSTKVQTPIFNKRIYFDINYNQLPKVSSIIFKIKFIQYDKNKEVCKSDTILWANYRLFDQNDSLKVGLHKINLHDREESDDIYYIFNDNPDRKASKLYFEIENFSKPVVNKIRIKNDNTKEEDEFLTLQSTSLQKANLIDEKSPFDDLNNYEKTELWRNRFAVVGISSLIPRLFLSCDYNSPNINQELNNLIKKINGLSVVQAIELLSGKYVNETVRNFAVKSLRKVNPLNIQTYLLQLVQALKYEKNHDNALARFLIEMAIEHPITIGHEFFWHLRSEMANQDVQQRFGLYLEVFLSKISRILFRIIRDEDTLLKNLIGIAEKIKNIKNIEERDRIFREDINVIDGYLKINKREVSLPLNFKYRIKGIVADKCRIMKSKKKPLWLTFENSDPLGDPIVVMLKTGDDLRMDMVTLQLFKAMQTVWFENGLNVKMSLYKVLCTGSLEGMLEMVTNAETLANIHVKEGGALSQFFSKGSIKNWIEKNCPSKKEAIENFMMSNVAYCLATFVLGIGDRHNDNIMIKKNGELFHIDFGHFLGHFKYKMGIKRERAPFVFTRQFQSVLGGDNSEAFKEFKSNLEKGYIILRNNKEIIITLLSILLCTGIPELNEKSLRFLENSLLLRKDDKEAIDFLNKKLNESMDSVSTKLNFAIHIVANK